MQWIRYNVGERRHHLSHVLHMEVVTVDGEVLGWNCYWIFSSRMMNLVATVDEEELSVASAGKGLMG